MLAFPNDPEMLIAPLNRSISLWGVKLVEGGGEVLLCSGDYGRGQVAPDVHVVAPAPALFIPALPLIVKSLAEQPILLMHLAPLGVTLDAFFVDVIGHGAILP